MSRENIAAEQKEEEKMEEPGTMRHVGGDDKKLETVAGWSVPRRMVDRLDWAITDYARYLLVVNYT